MTTRRPPRLALAALERFVPDGRAIAGDLIEEFQHRPSRAWFWWQALAAVAIAACSRTDEIRPLRLVDLQPADAQERARRRSIRFPPVNLTASPYYGVGGLGMVVLGALVTAVVPGAWWLLLASVGCGVLLGALMIVMRTRHAR